MPAGRPAEPRLHRRDHGSVSAITRFSGFAESSPEPAPEAEIPVAVSLGELLQQADSSWYRMVWEELFARWQVVLSPGIKPDFCDYAREYGLHCLIGQGDWDALRHLNRPAVLTLVSESGNRVPVFLQHMQNADLELIVGGKLYRMRVGQVGNYWYGDYVVLVQAPPGGRMDLRRGDRDTDVAWLREQFGIAQNIKIPMTDELLFDYQLQKQVLAFQRARGLVSDGIVGKNTMVHLNAATKRKDVPWLTGQ